MAKESNLIDLKRKMRNEHENYTLDGDSLRHDYRPWVNKVSLKLYIEWLFGHFGIQSDFR